MKALIAGMGNVLRGDDGFGVAVVAELARRPLPEGVRLMDAGIGGIHLVQDLFDPVELLVVLDANDTGRTPGSVVVMRPDVLDVNQLDDQQRRDQLADMHYATPQRAFMLARALRVLPAEHWLVGCQPLDASSLGSGLSQTVAQAVPVAAAEVRRLLCDAGFAWPCGPAAAAVESCR